MGIVLGYLCFLCLCLLLLKVLSRKLRFKKTDLLLMKTHKFLSAAFILLCLLHILFVFPVLKMRSTALILWGIAVAAVFTLLVIFCHRMDKDPVRQIRWHRILSAVLALCAASHIAAYFIDFKAYKEKIQSIALQELAPSRIADGRYIGEYDAGYIYAKVSVTVSDRRIQEIELIEHANERGGAAEQVVKKIVETQDFPVDAISGATNSSKVIEQAIQNALIGGINDD